MNRHLPALAFALIAPMLPAGPQTVSFQGSRSEHKWTLKELNPELPQDWSGYNFLVLELKASSPQRFLLTLFGGERPQSRDLHPLPNVWIRAAVPLEYYRRPNRAGFDLASVGKVPRASFWIGTSGAYGPLNRVDAIGVSMQTPHGSPTLEIRSVRLTKEDPGSDVLDRKPVVDEFGQWIPADWPGKVKSLQQLQQAWKTEDAGLRAGDFGYCKFGGYLNTKAKATGYFRVEQVDGRWWFVDPDGHHFFSTSASVMNVHGGESRIEGREDYYAALPPRRTAEDRRGSPSFYTWNLMRRHGDEFAEKWIAHTMARMESWGLNTVGNWSDPRLWDAKKKAYVVNLGGWGMESGYMGMPDVFSDEFPRIVDKAAERQCAPRKNDPYLLGYFLANEPPWPGRESLVVDVILERPPSAIQREAKSYLAGGDTPERRKQFIYRAFGRYLEVINAAVRKHDPNHLNLGLRYGGEAPPPEMLRASKTFDVYSMNVYATEVSRAVMEEIYAATGRPIIVGEFHFGVPGKGLAPGLVQVRDYAERGAAYRYYVEQAAAFPGFIGSSWFQWIDQPSTGRMDGENYNIGLVDVTDRPYEEMVKAIQETHRSLQSVHAGKAAPFGRKPRAQ